MGESEMNNIVVIDQGIRWLEDRSWRCDTEGEAVRLHQWLLDNGIQCFICDDETWNGLMEIERGMK
jgi:hypothetical protein